MRTTSLAVITALALAACSGIAPQPPSTAHDPNLPLVQQLHNLQAWTATGKASLRNSNASESVSLIWEQDTNQARIVLSGPLGAGATQIYSDGEILTVNRDGSLQTVDISSPEAIILNTGWNLPLQALPFWLKGLPYPELEIQKAQQDSASGRLISLHQDDWALEFQQYSQINSLMLPTRLRLEKEDTRVLVVIRHWEIGRKQ
jgi:outer membrane lipoprotein LolB